jgi:protein-S-isoprenylcysteine O-methyltransferase Ste14
MILPVNQWGKNSNLIKILLKIPVPWVFVMTYLVGLIPQFLIPVKIHYQEALSSVKIAGAILFVIGAFFASWSLIIFHNARTTTTPGKRSNKLVISGPYLISRNPMYISLILAYLGETGLLAQIWPLILLPLSLVYINFIVIPLEEKVLKNDFKEEYEKYCTQVHRWL